MMLADPGYETEMFKKSYSFFLKMHDYLMKLVENIFDTELWNKIFRMPYENPF